MQQYTVIVKSPTPESKGKKVPEFQNVLYCGKLMRFGQGRDNATVIVLAENGKLYEEEIIAGKIELQCNHDFDDVIGKCKYCDYHSSQLPLAKTAVQSNPYISDIDKFIDIVKWHMINIEETTKQPIHGCQQVLKIIEHSRKQQILHKGLYTPNQELKAPPNDKITEGGKPEMWLVTPEILAEAHKMAEEAQASVEKYLKWVEQRWPTKLRIYHKSTRKFLEKSREKFTSNEWTLIRTRWFQLEEEADKYDTQD